MSLDTDPVSAVGAANGDSALDRVDGNGENRRDRVAHETCCWPYGLSYHEDSDGGRLAVADPGDHRVMIWGARL